MVRALASTRCYSPSKTESYPTRISRFVGKSQISRYIFDLVNAMSMEQRGKLPCCTALCKKSAGDLEVRLPEPNARHERNPSQRLVGLLGDQ